MFETYDLYPVMYDNKIMFWSQCKLISHTLNRVMKALSMAVD